MQGGAGKQSPCNKSGDAAYNADCRALAREHQEYKSARCAERARHTDLGAPLHNRHRHRVVDEERADEQGYRRERDEVERK